MIEKAISVAGNVIAILTFILSILNWFDVKFEIDPSIPNKRVAASVLVIYTFFASYAGARMMLKRFEEGKTLFLLWFLLAFTYVFGFLYLQDKAITAYPMSQDQELVAAALVISSNVYIYYIVCIRPHLPDVSFWEIWRLSDHMTVAKLHFLVILHGFLQFGMYAVLKPL